MKIDREVISTYTIKPSSPTPDHIQNYQLSFLDQTAPPQFLPLVLFYPSDNHLSNTERSNQLKKSLSEALTRFYPLAGRLTGNISVNCNDEGVPYIEAQASCKLSDVLHNPIPKELNKFLPYSLEDVKDIGMFIQSTFFECGGMAVGVGISHKFVDGWSHVLFVTSWAAISRGDGDNTRSPRYDGATLFPPTDAAAGFVQTAVIGEKDELVTKRFVFTTSKIASLRIKFTDDTAIGEHQRRPTRIEALSAFIWTRFMTATRAKDNRDTMYMLYHLVNLRTRMNLPLQDCNYFGNFFRAASILPSIGNDKQGYGIVNQIRDAIRNVIRDEYVTKPNEGDKVLNFRKERMERVRKGEVVPLIFSSLCNFPSYEADFGWGKPVWVGSASRRAKNFIVFLDSQPGDGIEAWITLKLEDMAKLEADEELLKYAGVET